MNGDDRCIHCGDVVVRVDNHRPVLTGGYIHRRTERIYCDNLAGTVACPAMGAVG